MLWLVTLENGISAEFEAETQEEAQAKAQAGINSVAAIIPDKPPEIVQIEAI